MKVSLMRVDHVLPSIRPIGVVVTVDVPTLDRSVMEGPVLLPQLALGLQISQKDDGHRSLGQGHRFQLFENVREPTVDIPGEPDSRRASVKR
jgi:hypothetical protein